MESWFNWRAIQIHFFFLSWPFSYHPLGQATAIPLQQGIHTATHYNSLQHMSSDRTVTWKGTLQYHCNNNFPLQRTTTHCNMQRATGQQKRQQRCTKYEGEGGHTVWRTPIGCFIFIDNFSQKSPVIRGSFAKNDLQLKASCESSPPCTSEARFTCECVTHTTVTY